MSETDVNQLVELALNQFGDAWPNLTLAQFPGSPDLFELQHHEQPQQSVFPDLRNLHSL